MNNKVNTYIDKDSEEYEITITAKFYPNEELLVDARKKVGDYIFNFDGCIREFKITNEKVIKV